MNLADAHVVFICLTPVLTALIGWITNKAAIWMLFHPRKPVGAGPLKLQGLIPKRREEMAAKCAALVADHLLSPTLVEHSLARMDSGAIVEHVAQKLVYEGLAPRLAAIPLVGPMLVKNGIDGIYSAVHEKMTKEAPLMQQKIASQMASNIDVKGIVEERLNAFEEAELERVIRSVASKELRGIELAGAVLGFLVGLIQAGTMIAFMLLDKTGAAI